MRFLRRRRGQGGKRAWGVMNGYNAENGDEGGSLHFSMLSKYEFTLGVSGILITRHPT